MTIDACLGAVLIEFFVVILLTMFILWTITLLKQLKQSDVCITARFK